MIYYQGEQKSLNKVYKRIISVVPSQTELLYELGLEDEVIGITKFCIHPEIWYRNKQRVGGTKNLNLELIRLLSPDLVIANKEENTKEQIESIAENCDVWVSEISNLEQSIDMISTVGALTGRDQKAREIAKNIQNKFTDLASEVNAGNDKTKAKRAAYLIWREPYITVGGDTFITNMLTRCGFDNVFKDQLRYPETSIDELEAKSCDVIMLSSEPFPFAEKHVIEIKEALAGTEVILVDGELFSWYGSRLLRAPAYFKQLVNSLQ